MKDTAAHFAAANPILASGKVGHETDTGYLKIGDGATAWNSLTYTPTDSTTINVYLPDGIEDFADAYGNINLVDAAGNVEGVAIGAISSTIGSAYVVTAAKTKAAAICAEDGASAITTGSSVRALEARILLAGANTSANVSAFGAIGHIKQIASFGSIGHKAGLWGYAEMAASSAAIAANLTSGILAMLDVPATAVIAASGIASAIAIASQSLAGTHTGSAVCINVETPLAGTWDALLALTAASGVVATNTHLLSAGTTSSTLSHIITVIIDGTPRYIPVLAAVPAA